MDQLTFVRPGLLEWRDVAAPGLAADDDLLVRPVAVATCDLDTAIVHGLAPLPGPFALGHEFVGAVVDAGDRVGDLAAGDLVAIPFQISCGTCVPCGEGRTGQCATVPRMSAYGMAPIGGDWGGALSDLVRVPFGTHMPLRIPDGIEPAAVASLSDNLPDAWRTVGPHLAARPGADVLILGGSPQGSIPLYAVAFAAALGAGRIDYADPDPDRRALAAELGATVVWGEEAGTGEDGPGFPRRLGAHAITVDSTAHPGGLACALRSTEPGGVCTSTGIYYSETTPIPLLEMYSSGITFHTGRANARADMPEVLGLIAEGRVHPERITATVAPWDRAIEALGDHRLKLVVTRR